MQHYAIIVAGGQGTRMGTQKPKQFMLLDEIPILMRAAHAFFRSTYTPEIIIVLAEALQDEWVDLCHKFRFHVPHLIVNGGSTRFQSVYNGLEFIVKHRIAPENHENIAQATNLIAVHDAARPLVQPALIDRIFEIAHRDGACIPGVANTDSIRSIVSKTADGHPFETQAHETLNRDLVYKIQTPQTFRAHLIWDAYQQEESSSFTDDASVVETKKIPITLIDGDPINLKITHSQDIAIAEAILKQHLV